jgi:hypothetical protein
LIFVISAEEMLHGFDQFRDPFITDAVIDKVGIFAKIYNALIAENPQVLGNVGVAGVDLVTDISYAQFAILEQAENFQPDGM